MTSLRERIRERWLVGIYKRRISMGSYAISVRREDALDILALLEAELVEELDILTQALERIREGGQGCEPCQCEHDENCCATASDYCCPTCIAHIALESRSPKVQK